MSRLYKNIIYNLIGRGLLLILGLVSIKYIFKQLGEDALGIIYFTSMMNVVICAVLEMGISSTTVREISGSVKTEPEYINNLIRTFSLFYWTAYIILGVTFFFIAPVMVEKWINLKTMDTATATTVLRILGITSLIALPKSFYTCIFSGLQRMEFINFIDVFTTAFQQIGTILIISLKGSLFYVVYWFASCYLFRLLIYIVSASYFFSLQTLCPGYSVSVIKRNWHFASRMMATTIIATVHTQIDKLIISKLLPVGVLGYYSLAYANVSKGTLLTGAISQAVYPVFSELYQSGNHIALMSKYRKMQDLLCFGIVPIFAAIPFVALPLFSYILNENIAIQLILPITFLCIGFYMNGTLTIPYMISLAIGEPGIAARLNFYCLFFIPPAAFLLINFFGLTGAGFSFVFYHILAYSYGVPLICSKCLKIRVSEWFIHVIRIYILIGLSYGVSGILVKFFCTPTIISLLTAYLGASVIYLAGAYFLIGEELREVLERHLHT